MKTILEFLISKKNHYPKTGSFEIFKNEFLDNKEAPTEEIISTIEKLPDVYLNYLFDVINELIEDNGYKVKIGEGGNVHFDENTKLIELYGDSYALNITIYNVPKTKALLIPFYLTDKELLIYYHVESNVENMLSFCLHELWNENEEVFHCDITDTPDINKFKQKIDKIK